MKKIILYYVLSICFISQIVYGDTYLGYVKQIDMSFCMDVCSEYYLEGESGENITNITFASTSYDPSIYLNRFVEVQGEEIWCVECEAVQIEEISFSNDCESPVFCFADPCEVAPECQLNTPVECVPNYCDGCYADFYDLDGNLVDCYVPTINPCDDLGGLFFGLCDMYLGIAIVNGECEGVSGCGWDIDGVDYSDAFFNTFSECEDACLNEPYVCEDIEYDYDQLHSGEYTSCEVNNDCMAVWGDCGVGLGGCHYAVNPLLYDQDAVSDLVPMWLDNDCMQWVCDCASLPNTVCNNGSCELAYCYDENPVGCFASGCPDNYGCIDYEEAGDCVPSYCGCDGDFYGNWFCTEDCNGGTCYEYGDINYDDDINIVDVVSLVNVILGLSPSSALCDINSDQTVNVIDVIILVNTILN